MTQDHFEGVRLPADDADAEDRVTPMDLPPARSHPLVTIRFVRNHEVERRHWSHVPRVGDKVILNRGEGEFRGTVKEVVWLDDGTVDIDLSPEWLPDAQ